MLENSDSNLSAHTLVPESNISYLSNTHYAAPGDPLSGTTMGLLMVLSTLQYQSPYVGQYSTAASQAGKAAYVESGGQAFQDKLTGKVTVFGKTIAGNAVKWMGLTPVEVGIVVGVAGIVKTKQLHVSGPYIYSIHTDLTITPTDGRLGLRYEW